MSKKTHANIRLYKTKSLPVPDDEVLKMLVQFIELSAVRIGIPKEQLISVTLLSVPTDEPITTGAFNTQDKTIRVIAQNRNMIDYARTIAHEMTHLKQLLDGELVGDIPEVGGEIEDEANAMSGRIVKSYIKNTLTPEQKKHLGLGTF